MEKISNKNNEKINKKNKHPFRQIKQLKNNI